MNAGSMLGQRHFPHHVANSGGCQIHVLTDIFVMSSHPGFAERNFQKDSLAKAKI
jgi:hypothetical protein